MGEFVHRQIGVHFFVFPKNNFFVGCPKALVCLIALSADRHGGRHGAADVRTFLASHRAHMCARLQPEASTKGR